MSKLPPETRVRVRPSALSAADVALFRDSMHGVKPLESDTLLLRRNPSRRPVRGTPSAERGVPRLTDPSITELTPHDSVEFKRVGVQHAVMRKLRRGDFPIERALDLHGATGVEAKARLLGFIRVCQADGARCIRIIHGKGYRSPDHQPVLKPRIAHWLSQHPAVVAYSSARANDGGTGAVYVLLKRDG